MAFDKELDKQLFSETIDFETTRITVAVFSYNEGVPKLQLARENLNTNDGSWTWAKLGRMTKKEAEAIIPILPKAIVHMK